MQVTILSFAQLREQLGFARLELELEAGTQAGQLKSLLAERYPEAALSLDASRLAINRSYVANPEQLLQAGDEIALIPPVSGG